MYRNLIQVVNKHKRQPTKHDVYCGRGSPLGNPYSHIASKFPDVVELDSRDKACDAFEVYLDKQLEDPKSPQRKAMAKLYNHVKKGNPLNLVCFCKPSRCHVDYVRTLLIEALEKKVRNKMKLVKGYLKYPTKPQPFNCYLFTANRVVKNNGELVMGGGNALAFAKAYPDSPLVFGSIIETTPDTVFDVCSSPNHNGLLGVFVTKHHYNNPSCLELVAEAVQELKYTALTNPHWTYHLPYPAIGLGGLSKDQVRPLIRVLPDNVIVYE